MLIRPTRTSPLLHGAESGDAATHAVMLLAATYDAVQGRQEPPPPDEQLDKPVCSFAEELYKELLRSPGAEASEKLRQACTKAALLMHPPGWEVVEARQPGQPPRLVTPCLPWQHAALAWRGYSSTPDGQGRHRYLTLDLGSHEQGDAAAWDAKAAEAAEARAAAGCQLRRGGRLQGGKAQAGQQQQGQPASAASGGAGEGGSDAEEATDVEEGTDAEAEEEQGRARKRQRTGKPMACRVRVCVHPLVGLVMWGSAPVDQKTGQRMELMHVCNEPRCANPAHLVWGTHKENMGASAAAFQPALDRCGHRVAAA